MSNSTDEADHIDPTQSDPAPLATILGSALQRQRSAFLRDGPPDAATRRDRLSRAKALLKDHARELIEALQADYGVRPAELTMATEIFSSVQALEHARKHLRRWMRPERRHVPFMFRVLGVRASVYRQPKGVVGVISPWNFPVNLVFAPLAGVLAAGNRCLVKPSELTPETSEVIRRLVAEYFAPEELSVITGGPDVGQAFSRLDFDHLLFTGSTTVGRHVMSAAAETLTPVTLELGGKSPTVIGRSADVDEAAARIVTGKLLNAGQICLAPDYLFVPRDSVGSVIEAVRRSTAECYPTLRENPQYASVISEKHAQRLVDSMEDARTRGVELTVVNPGGEEFDPVADRRLPLAIAVDPPDDARIMQEEIFGPILPIVPYDSFDEVVSRINDGPRPLALYYFGSDRKERERLVRETVSGAVCVNDVVIHVSMEDLPLGGVGASGMGRYHGNDGFLEFTHRKAVFRQGFISTAKFFRPPYDEKTRALLKRLTGVSL